MSGRTKVSISSITEEKKAAVEFGKKLLFGPVGVAVAQGSELHFFRSRVECGGDVELLRGSWFWREHGKDSRLGDTRHKRRGRERLMNDDC